MKSQLIPVRPKLNSLTISTDLPKMSLFDRHLRVGMAVHSICVLPIVIGGFWILNDVTGPLSMWLATLPATLLGSVAPDVDHHASHTYRSFLRWGPAWIGLSVGGGLTVWIARNSLTAQIGPPSFVSGYTLGVCVGGLTIGSVVIAYYAIPRLRPRHRGVLHSIPAGGFAAIIGGVYVKMVCVAAGLPQANQIAFGWGIAIGIGYLTHLWEDDAIFTRSDTS